MSPLSHAHPEAEYRCGDFLVIYVLSPENQMVGLRLLPVSKAHATVAPRRHLDTPEMLALPDNGPIPAYRGESSLVQLKLSEDDSGVGFSAGRSMRCNPTVDGLRFHEQTVLEMGDGFSIVTELRGTRHFACIHTLTYHEGDEAVTVDTRFENHGASTLTLEMLSSFEVGTLSPFDTEDSVERLRVHRFRSLWSAEGRHENVALEDLHLERSWSSFGVANERFGQVGSMPVRGFFPFVAVEDFKESVFWGAQLACPSSWQMEIYRREDKISISGGLADREFGHWMKRIAPGESFTTPKAFLSTSTGTFDAFCQRLVRMQTAALPPGPKIEEDLPIIFNEWCSSWGSPTPEFIERTANRLQQTPVKIFVIDDGWAEKRDNVGQQNGDWNVDEKRFPKGLRAVTDSLRQRGMRAGLWFEFEVCTTGTDAYDLPDHKLRKDGRTIQIGPRQFWDFRDPWTFEYLTRKVIDRLSNDGFGYLKVDYNETIGLGCEDPDSLGEGLRQHIAGVQKFFHRIREAMPDLIIEMCSSGGHRLEPSMLALASMGSFSDAHESADIPIIAANLHRLILPRQSQIWAVLHASDSLQRLHYSLTACFLGRACLSGEIFGLSNEQFSLVQESLDFYESVRPIIRDGESSIFRRMGKSNRRPQGFQAVVRTSRPNPGECLVVLHAFERLEAKTFEVQLPTPGSWSLLKQSASGMTSTLVSEQILRVEVEASFSSGVVHLKKMAS